jgi:electron transfer flavoprotein alpha/beta subunit
MSAERIRIEVAFDGGQVIAINVAPEAAEGLERALSAGAQETFPLDGDDGYYTVALRRVVWIKRSARESRVGFGA